MKTFFYITYLKQLLLLYNIYIFIFQVLYLLSLASFRTGNNDEALILAQKAVHCYPNMAEGWAILIASLLNIEKHIYPRKSLLTTICLYVEELNPSENLFQWIRNYIQTNFVG